MNLCQFSIFSDNFALSYFQISHEALIPLGSKALAYGQIIHTNEILCLLGDNYFLECSAKSAVGIVDRRLKSMYNV